MRWNEQTVISILSQKHKLKRSDVEKLVQVLIDLETDHYLKTNCNEIGSPLNILADKAKRAYLAKKPKKPVTRRKKCHQSKK